MMQSSRSLALVALVGSFASSGARASDGHDQATIDPARLSATAKDLSADVYEGRAPGTPAGERAVDYIIDRFKALGLTPAGEHGGWTQTVSLVQNELDTPKSLFVDVGGNKIPLAVGTDISPKTARPGYRLTIKAAPLVFVGYGVSAKERGWDDFKGVDLHGKIAVILVNDPDFAAEPGEPVAGKFGGKAMTLYGRWTYKYEEAARRGAAGALLIHDAAAAGYDWSVARNTAGGTFDVVRAPEAAQAVPMQAWISGEFASKLFERAGLHLEALKRQARSATFRPVPIGDARFTIDVAVHSRRVESHNVLARLEGTTRRNEAVMYGAHWDAFGIGAPDAQGRVIRAGALDDAIGVAGLFELARAFRSSPRPKRSIIFAAWTAEERGLLGSESYALNPVQQIGSIVANLTIDVLQSAGPSRDVVLVGAGQNELEDDLAKAAAEQGRTVTPDSHSERGLFYRADHFSFAKRGVPTLLLMGLAGGPDLVSGGRAGGEAWVNDYTNHCYHQPCDQWSPTWDLRGAAADVALFYRVGESVANSGRWPKWRPQSEFRSLRP